MRLSEGDRAERARMRKHGAAAQRLVDANRQALRRTLDDHEHRCKQLYAEMVLELGAQLGVDEDVIEEALRRV